MYIKIIYIIEPFTHQICQSFDLTESLLKLIPVWSSGPAVSTANTKCTYEYNLLDERPVADRHRCHMAARSSVFVDENHSKLHTLYWLPKIPYKSSFNANSSSCTTIELSMILTSCLTAIKTCYKNCETCLLEEW